MTGSALVEGAEIFNAGLLDMQNAQISNNSGNATGPSGSAQGEGIWNSTIPDGPPIQLTMRDSSVTRNTLTPALGSRPQGGGVYTTLPITLTSSLIAKEHVRQLLGC
jgi:hypothetical protein